MNKRIIFTSFAYIDNYNSSANVKRNRDKIDLYVKNAFVTLFTAKINNTDCDVALITNVKDCDLFKLYDQYGIKVFYCPYDDFKMPSDFRWSLAFYKFCALKFAASLDYSDFCLIDSDVVSIGSIAKLWDLTSDNICVYDLFELYHEEISFKHLGGEFIACNSKNIKKYIDDVAKYYNYVLLNKIVFDSGDEYITSRVLNSYHNLFFVNDLIVRCWTGTTRDVPKGYKIMEYAMLHVPAEKQYGMIKLYKTIVRTGKIDNFEIIKSLHIKRPSLFSMLKIAIKFILNKKT